MEGAEEQMEGAEDNTTRWGILRAALGPAQTPEDAEELITLGAKSIVSGNFGIFTMILSTLSAEDAREFVNSKCHLKDLGEDTSFAALAVEYAPTVAATTMFLHVMFKHQLTLEPAQQFELAKKLIVFRVQGDYDVVFELLLAECHSLFHHLDQLLATACLHGNPTAISFLHKVGADINYVEPQTGDNLLHLFIRGIALRRQAAKPMPLETIRVLCIRDNNALRALLAHQPDLVNRRNVSGNNPLTVIQGAPILDDVTHTIMCLTMQLDKIGFATPFVEVPGGQFCFRRLPQLLVPSVLHARHLAKHLYADYATDTAGKKRADKKSVDPLL